jgi:hypothetical protein
MRTDKPNANSGGHRCHRALLPSGVLVTFAILPPHRSVKVIFQENIIKTDENTVKAPSNESTPTTAFPPL